MSREAHVLIPKERLEKLEAARVGLFEMLDRHKLPYEVLAEMLQHTRVMWELTHRRWDETETEEAQWITK